MSRLPIEDVLSDLCDTLIRSPNGLLTAPPGAGKTTRVPLALANVVLTAGKIALGWDWLLAVMPVAAAALMVSMKFLAAQRSTTRANA